MFYAKIGAMFVCNNGYSHHAIDLAKFETASAAIENAYVMRRLFLLDARVTAHEVAA